MPSLHIAWAVLVHASRCGGSASAAGCVRSRVLYPCLTAFAVLATGNHFLLDMLGGLLAMALSVWLVGSPQRLAGRLSLARVPLPARLRRAP